MAHLQDNRRAATDQLMLNAQMGDLFYVTQRANVAAGVQVATGVGFAAGQAIAGFVGAHQRASLPSHTHCNVNVKACTVKDADVALQGRMLAGGGPL